MKSKPTLYVQIAQRFLYAAIFALLVVSCTPAPPPLLAANPTALALDGRRTAMAQTRTALDAVWAGHTQTAGVPSPTASPTPTATPTAQPTDTPTPTPSPTPATLQQGIYKVGQCLRKLAVPQYDIHVVTCVETVWVTEEHLVVTMSWLPLLSMPVAQVTKRPDLTNKNMYLTDETGGRYDHIATGGDAATFVVLYSGNVAFGYFVFPVPDARQTTFVFHDDDEPKDAATEPFTLAQPDLLLPDVRLSQSNYRLALETFYPFLPGRTEDGRIRLTHAVFKECSLEELLQGEPTGARGDTVTLAGLLYRWYGEAHTNLEALLVRGPADLDPNARIRFAVSYINATMWVSCRNSILAVLKTLGPVTP